jgi:hypothetical protein
MIQRGSSRLDCVLPVFLFWWFSESFLGFSMVKFWGRFFEGFLLDVTYEDLVPLCLVILLQQTLRNSFNLVGFSGVDGWLPIPLDWVGFGDRAFTKGRPQGTPSIPKVSLESMQRIRRSIEVNVMFFFPRAEFFPTAWANPVWPVSQIGLTGLPLVGCREEFFWTGESHSRYGFSCSKVVGILRCFGLFWSRRSFEDFLVKTGLTSLPNGPDRFPLHVNG